MIIYLTKRERATILAALRRWLSYPAAREADSIATSGGKHKPLDNGEIDRLCKRITEPKTKRDGEQFLRQSNNGARERKGLKLRGDVSETQHGDHLRLADIKGRRHFRKVTTGHAIGSGTE
jgi:hypothetical protein